MSISRSIRVILLSLTTLLLLWNCQIDMSPVARDDTAATDRNVPVTITMVTNDTAGTGSIVASTVAVVAGPEHGTAHAQADGTVIYSPATDFVGTDSFSYVVTDTAGETSNTAMVTVTVRAVNRAPVANAGPDINAVTGRPVILDGAQSFDPDRDPLSFTWQFVAVPPTSSVTTASLANAQTAAPSFTPDVDGTYGLDLTVSDGTLSSTDQVQVTAVSRPNVPPNANAGQPQTTLVGTVVLLDGSGSQDPDNGPQPLAFQWSFVAIPPESALTTADLQGATTPLATFTPDMAGVYRVGLQVSDGHDASQTEVQITATPPDVNAAPNANAGPDMVVQLGDAVTLNGTASHDPDNRPQPLTYQWTLVSKPTASGLTDANIQDATTATPSFTPDVAGFYVLRVDVSDGALGDFAQVLVKANAAPVAVDDTFNADQDQTLTVPAPGVLSNDTDGNNDPLTVVLGQTVSHGALTLNADGSFTYTPTTGFLGTDGFTYQANDGSINSNMAAVTVTVTKPHVNQAPVVKAATFSIAENSTTGTVVGTVTFTDPDAGQSHAFTITAGNPNNAFAIASTGQITVATSTALNFETTPGFSLTVQVTDNGTPAQSGSAVMTVNLSNVNELPVVNAATFAVLENSPNGTVVGTVTFTDPDVGQSGTFTITTGNTNSAFAINASTGQLTVANSTALNSGTTPSFSLTVQVTDNGAPPLAGSATITVIVTKVNEAPTVAPATLSIAENSATGTTVGTVSFTDPNTGQNHTFAITGGNTGGAFAINPSTGQLTVATSTALNFEMTPSFNLIVQVTDNGTPPLAGSATITVNVTNVNEAPVVNAATFAVLENSPNGTVVGTVTFTDPDVGQSGTFTITTGNTNSAFAINASTGQLTVANSTALNSGTTPSFSLTVQVTDNGAPPLAGSATITVIVTKVNEAPTVAPATLSIAENSATGTTVGTVSFTDPNTGQNHTFAITGGNTGGAFAINPSTGQLTVATSTALNFEMTPSFNLIVQVTDNGTPPLAGSATITVNVTNINEAPVVNAATFTVPENSPNGTVVGVVTFTDPDVGQSGPFAITGGSGSGVFAINPSTGQLTVATSTALNFEMTPSFSLIVQVTDNGTPAQSGSATITVNLTNVNEAPVVNMATFTVPENSTNGTVVGTVTFTDPDAGQSHTFAIVGGNTGGVFTINPSTGQLTVANSAALNIGTTPSFNLTVRVTDNGAPPLSGSATITVNLTNVNHAPSFTLGPNQTVNEDAGSQSVPGWATAIRAGPANESGQSLTFNITGNTNPALLSTGPAVSPLGELTYTPAANANGTSTITVTLSDNGGTANGGMDTSTPQTFTITVTAINDPPTANGFTNLPAQAGIPIKYPAGKLGGTDVESGTTVTIETTPDGTMGGAVTINADGSFEFTPLPSTADGMAQFTYHVCDNETLGPGLCSSPATVSFSVAGPAIYFVKSSAVGAGNCTLSNECTLTTALTNIGTVMDAKIFIGDSGTYSNTVTLNSDGWLIGQRVTGMTFDTLFGISVPAQGVLAERPSLGGNQPTPTIQGTVTLATDSAVRGLSISTSSATGLSGSAASGVTVSEVDVTTESATVVHLTNTDGTILNNNITMRNVVANTHTILITFSGTGSSSALLISGNKVTHNGVQDSDGIHVDILNANPIPNFSVTVTDNDVTALNGRNAISLNAEQSSMACFYVLSNKTVAPNGIGILVRRRPSSTVRLGPGDPLSGLAASVVLSANNPKATGDPDPMADSDTVVDGAVAALVATCPTPSSP